MTTITELKSIRDAAWASINPTLPHSLANDWLPFARANSQWYQAHMKELGCQPPSDAVDKESTDWYNRNKRAYTHGNFSNTRKSKIKKGK